MSTREYVMLCTGFAFDGEVGRVKTAGSVAQRVLSQRSCGEDEEEGKYFLVARVVIDKNCCNSVINNRQAPIVYPTLAATLTRGQPCL